MTQTWEPAHLRHVRQGSARCFRQSSWSSTYLRLVLRKVLLLWSG